LHSIIAFIFSKIISCEASQKLPMEPSTLHCLKHNENPKTNDSGGCQLGLANKEASFMTLSLQDQNTLIEQSHLKQ